MAINLDNIFASNTQESIGVGKDSTGKIEIKPTDNQPVEIKTTGDTTALQVNNDATIQLSDGGSVNEIIDAFDDSTPNTNVKLGTVNAIINYFQNEIEGLQHHSFESKAAFDAKVWVESDFPEDAFVTDPSPFSYTDNEGHTITNVDWMKLHGTWVNGSAHFHILASSANSGQMTDAEVKLAYENNTNTNAFTDAYKGQLDNAPSNINNELAAKQTSINTNSTNISNNQSNINSNSGSITSLQTDKLNKSGDTLTGKLDVSGDDIELIGTTGNRSSIIFRESNGTADQRRYDFTTISGEKFALIPRADSGLGTNPLTYSHGGTLNCPAITQNNNSVLDTTDVGTNINDGAGTITDTVTIKNYIDTQDNLKASLSGATFVGNITTTDNQIEVHNTNGEGVIKLICDTAPANEKIWQVYTHTNGDLFIESRNDSNGLVNRFVFENGSGNLSVPGTISLSGGDIPTQNDLLLKANLSGANFTGNIGIHTPSTGSSVAIKQVSTSNDLIDIFNPSGIQCWHFKLQGSNLRNLGLTESGVADNRVVITQGGNIGINTADPQARLDVNGDLKARNNLQLDGNFLINNLHSYIELRDKDNNLYHISRDDNSNLKTGIVLRATTNPPAGEPIFQVQSAEKLPRLRIEHDGNITSLNRNMYLGADVDGNYGQRVLTNDNYHEEFSDLYYYGSLPNLSASDIVNWRGRSIYFFGVGYANPINLPSIVASNASSSQVEPGAWFYLYNFNASENLSVVAASGQKIMVDNVSNVGSTGGSEPIYSSTKVKMIATDLRNYGTVGAFCWALTGI